jgi:hypothetical protein
MDQFPAVAGAQLPAYDHQKPRSRCRLDQPASRSIQGSGAKIVHIREHRNIYVRGDNPVVVDDLGHRDDRLVRHPEQFLIGGTAADEHTGGCTDMLIPHRTPFEYRGSEICLVGLRDWNEALIEMILIVLGTDHFVEGDCLLTLITPVTPVTLSRVPRHRECTGILNVNLDFQFLAAELEGSVGSSPKSSASRRKMPWLPLPPMTPRAAPAHCC